MDRRRWLQYERSQRAPDRCLFGAAPQRREEPAQRTSNPAFDMTAIARFSRRAGVGGDIVILASPADHCASKLLGVVAMDCAHLPPARPLSLHSHVGEPMLFR